ncbi:MAG: hypothetical protein FWH44_04425 [Methanomassiliicoccaceae archaeon]|nr:hypothetical protein [Methanomassiliicoccaceae archaeon]
MSLLSAVPRGIVIAMQVALAALVILAVVPIALGGVHVDVKDNAKIEYDVSGYAVTVSMRADIDADLYFDITGAGYIIYMTSGNETLPIYRQDLGTLGSGSVDISRSIPLTVIVMMMLCGASGNSDTVVTMDIRGSTLGGMISAAARIDAPIAKITDGGGAITDGGGYDVLEASFKVKASELIEDMFKAGITIMMGDPINGTECTVTFTDDGDHYLISVKIESSSGNSFIDDIGDTSGGVKVYYDGTEKELSEEDADLVVRIFEILYERW